jgi:hypothetical protein
VSAKAAYAPEVRVHHVVQCRSRDGIWEDHYTFPDQHADRALAMAEGMDEDYTGPWRVVSRTITDEQVWVFDSRTKPEGNASCHPYDEPCSPKGLPCRNHGGTVPKPDLSCVRGDTS